MTEAMHTQGPTYVHNVICYIMPSEKWIPALPYAKHDTMLTREEHMAQELRRKHWQYGKGDELGVFLIAGSFGSKNLLEICAARFYV